MKKILNDWNKSKQIRYCLECYARCMYIYMSDIHLQIIKTNV